MPEAWALSGSSETLLASTAETPPLDVRIRRRRREVGFGPVAGQVGAADFTSGPRSEDAHAMRGALLLVALAAGADAFGYFTGEMECGTYMDGYDCSASTNCYWDSTILPWGNVPRSSSSCQTESGCTLQPRARRRVRPVLIVATSSPRDSQVRPSRTPQFAHLRRAPGA